MKQATAYWIPLSRDFAAGKLQWKDYLHNLFLNCTPPWILQPRNYINTEQYWWLLENDALAFTVFCYQDKVACLKDVSKAEAVFIAAAVDDVNDVEATLNALDCVTADFVNATLALWALKGRCLNILKLCLRWSAKWKSILDFYPSMAFTDEAYRVSKDAEPELWALINDAPRWPAQLDHLVEPSLAKAYFRKSIMMRDKGRYTWRQSLHDMLFVCTSSKLIDAEIVDVWHFADADHFTCTAYTTHNKFSDINNGAQLEELFYAAEGGKLDAMKVMIDQLPQKSSKYVCALLAIWLQDKNRKEMMNMVFDRSAFKVCKEFEPRSVKVGQVTKVILKTTVNTQEEAEIRAWGKNNCFKRPAPAVMVYEREYSIGPGHPLW